MGDRVKDFEVDLDIKQLRHELRQLGDRQAVTVRWIILAQTCTALSILVLILGVLLRGTKL